MSLDPKIAADWMNRIGLITGFLSFWLAAPEILGEERLKRWEGLVKRSVERVPSVAAWSAFFIVLPLCIWLFFAAWSGLDMTSYIRLSCKSDPAFYDSTPESVIAGWSGIGIVVAISISIAVRRKVAHLLTAWIVQPCLKRFADDTRIRQRALFAAAITFIISFALQFSATFIDTARR